MISTDGTRASSPHPTTERQRFKIERAQSLLKRREHNKGLK
jgi:hypothetical protein